jgi:hypothetical protein
LAQLLIRSIFDVLNLQEVTDSIHGGECNMRLSKKRKRAHD